MSLKKLKSAPVFFYTDIQIAPFGQGASIRIYTNLRAYVDLGCKVEVVQFQNKRGPLIQKNDLPSPEIKLTQIDYMVQKVNKFNRLMYYLGYAKSSVLDVLFPIRPFVVEEVKKRNQLIPDAIHHFEYDQMASAAVAFKKIKAIWSNHDILSIRIPMLREMRKVLKSLSGRECSRRLRLVRTRTAEDWISNHSKLILNIAKHENTEFVQNRRYPQAELLPMSWPDEEAPKRQRGWMANGILRMLHLGSVDGFIGYDSLRFILENVFPLLHNYLLESLELLVVGKIGETHFSQHILQLAREYPQVKFLGYINDIKPIYAEVDLQLVGGVRATGLRTRIVESMVFGVPVLSMKEMAKGLHMLRHGENILLAENAREFADEIVKVMATPECLPKLAVEGRKTYEKFYSREVEADSLAQYLEKYT